ncbi:5' nucleotidase, NT5C type [Bacillus sp. JJ722]|uniref:5' nucleotidase, NT5C type n=1 Tax=Bacillus sp. JJ722 TaxID=3122973 RepID=UPI002FFE35DD
MTKIRFGIDIDGTITRPDTFLPFLNKDFGLTLTIEDITEYDLTPFVNVQPSVLAQWFTKNEAMIYEASPLYEGAKEVVNRWSNLGDLYFISARNTHLMDVTEMWFHKNQVAYHHIELIGTHNKIATVKKHNINVFFEDKHDNAVEISEECDIPVILFNTAYNQGSIPSNVIRVNNWQEAENWVNNSFKL